MYYTQVGLSIALLGGIAFSLIYSLMLVIKLIKKRSNKRETMKKTFISAFLGWISIFLIVLIWQDKANWNIKVGLSLLIISILVSLVIAAFSALSFWSWRE